MRLLRTAVGIAEAELPVAAGPVFLPLARHGGDEVEPFQPAPFRRLLFQRLEVEFAARAVRDHRIGRARQADAVRVSAVQMASAPALLALMV